MSCLYNYLICRMCRRIKGNVCSTISVLKPFLIFPLLPLGIPAEHTMLGMDSKFLHLACTSKSFLGFKNLILSGLHYCSSLALQEFYNRKNENENYRFGICTVSFCQPGFALGVRHTSVCLLQITHHSCMSNKMMI